MFIKSLLRPGRSKVFIHFHSLALFVFLSSLASCTAPFTSQRTAQTIGADRWELSAGFDPLPNLGVTRGFGDNFELSLRTEVQILSVDAKLAFLNQKTGLSLATFAGTFLDANAAKRGENVVYGYFLGPIASYKISFFEPYALAKFSDSHVHNPPENDFEKSDVWWERRGKTILGFRGDAVLGFNIWFTENFGLNINAKWSSEFNVDGHVFPFPSLNLLWRS